MRLVGIALVVAGMACAGAPPPRPIANSSERPVARVPEIVEGTFAETDPPPPPADCAAEPPSGGLLDRESPVLAKIEVKKSRVVIEERATYRPGAHPKLRELTVTTGGCAHVATRFELVLADRHDAADLGYHLKQAIELLAALPIPAGRDRDFREDLAARLRARTDDSCSYFDGEMTTVSCHVEARGEGIVVVELAYDIAI